MKKRARVILNARALDTISRQDRIVTDYRELKELVKHCKGLGIRIVMTQGTFDMVHIGHGRYLEEAKKYGDILIVGVDDDEKIRARKGPDRPVVPEDERFEMLAHLRHVDFVFRKKINDPKWKLIKTVQPDVLITISETHTDAERKELQKYCDTVKVLKRQATTSTSAKLRFLQMGVAHKLGHALTPKLVKAIQEALVEINDKVSSRNTKSQQ